MIGMSMEEQHWEELQRTRQQVIDALQQRDQLLEALKEAYDQHCRVYCGCGYDKCSNNRVREIVQTAIAAVENEEEL